MARVNEHTGIAVTLGTFVKAGTNFNKALY